MKCPYCGYEDSKLVKSQFKAGKEGRFYTSHNHICLTRLDDGDIREYLYLLGCPKCKKVFMD